MLIWLFVFGTIMKCPHCGTETDKKYCPTCGYRFTRADGLQGENNLKQLLRILKNSSSVIAFILFIAFMVLNTSIVLWSVEWILPETMEASTVIYVVLLIPIGLTNFTGSYFAVYFLGMVALVFLSYIIIFYKSGDKLFSYIGNVINSGGKKSKGSDSQLPRLAFVFTALIFVSYFYYIALEMVGIIPEAPGLEDLPLWRLIYELVRAAVWEELTVRVVFLGIPMLIYGYTRRKDNLWRYLYGGFGLNNRFVIFPILFSASVFSVAHIASWDLYKIFPTFVAGLAFGYLFAKDGLHSCILLHFVWDFTSVPTKVFDIPNGDMLLALLVIFWMAVGMYYTFHYIRRSIKWMVTSIREEKEEDKFKFKEEEPKTAGVSTAYSCPNCGNYRAIYTDKGKLKCKRCGLESDPMERQIQQAVNNKSRTWPPY